MPYEIKHKSYDVCYVKYVRNKRYQGSLIVDLSLAILGVITISISTIMIGTPFFFLIAFILCFALGVIWPKADFFDNSSEFEIELNRALGIVFVRNSQYKHKKPTTYSFSTFKGFGFRKTPFTHKSKALFQAELIFKMEPIRGMPRDIPLRNQTYLVSPKNAEHIVKEIDEWLKPDKIQQLEDPVPEAEIIRDFRDMDKSESGPD